MNSLSKKTTCLTAFSIAMGFLETAVVIYLRKIYYPSGFSFPLTPIDPAIAVIEVFREAATIIMLAAIGILTGNNRKERFAFFIYSFAIWDIFYYVFLKVFLDWPASFFTWDILFLIPVPWVGPVLAPCIVSLTMVLLAYCLLHFQKEDGSLNAKFKFKEALAFVIGCTLILTSFLWDYLIHIAHSSKNIVPVDRQEFLLNDMQSYVPQTYNWWLFWLGEALIIYGIICYTKSQKTNSN